MFENREKKKTWRNCLTFQLLLFIFIIAGLADVHGNGAARDGTPVEIDAETDVVAVRSELPAHFLGLRESGNMDGHDVPSVHGHHAVLLRSELYLQLFQGSRRPGRWWFQRRPLGYEQEQQMQSRGGLVHIPRFITVLWHIKSLNISYFITVYVIFKIFPQQRKDVLCLSVRSQHKMCFQLLSFSPLLFVEHQITAKGILKRLTQFKRLFLYQIFLVYTEN